ncbi:MAG: 6,7-dimethyl-8-ribityllumazine synthase [Candidatus Omnitrophica bacterium]|nr:6,7-dimethyl-8-ribityllumazine synthase [Candidatus Omnitrophota bacterium]MCM8806560.1 6,7-dimethyl-8-ribityllumazine synthase [Candidatus Omnitrophota bacterium]
MKIIEGYLDAKGKRFGIIVSRFNEFISKRLLEGALDCLKRHNADEENVEIIWVPGAVEMVYVIGKLSESNKYDAIICLGAVIRGDTPHFEYVASQITRGISQANYTGKTPVTFGIITADSVDQAIERAGTKAGNKGWQAALSAIEMANLKEKI